MVVVIVKGVPVIVAADGRAAPVTIVASGGLAAVGSGPLDACISGRPGTEPALPVSKGAQRLWKKRTNDDPSEPEEQKVLKGYRSLRQQLLTSYYPERG